MLIICTLELLMLYFIYQLKCHAKSPKHDITSRDTPDQDIRPDGISVLHRIPPVYGVLGDGLHQVLLVCEGNYSRSVAIIPHYFRAFFHFQRPSYFVRQQRP